MNANAASLVCNMTNFNPRNGSILNLAVARQADDFIGDAVVNWKVDLNQIDAIDGKTVLDYGCGSGILAMVARKLGAGSVAGVDIDPQAIESARDNAQRNQVGEIEYFLPDSFAASAHANARFDIVVANILSSPLKLMAPMLSGRVAEGGSLILSGVLARQAEEVAAAYAPFIKLGVWAELDGVSRFQKLLNKPPP
eukprot:gene2641-3425_t